MSASSSDDEDESDLALAAMASLAEPVAMDVSDEAMDVSNVDDSGSAPPVNLGGRPRRVDPELSGPVWPDDAGQSTHSLRKLLKDMFTVASDNNLTETVSIELFDTLRDHLPQGHSMPSYPHAVDMILRDCPVKCRRYPTCGNLKCKLPTVLEKSLSEMDKDELAKLSEQRCSNCHEAICDKKKLKLKVRLHTEDTTYAEWTFANAFSDVSAILFLPFSLLDLLLDGTRKPIAYDVRGS